METRLQTEVNHLVNQQPGESSKTSKNVHVNYLIKPNAPHPILLKLFLGSFHLFKLKIFVAGNAKYALKRSWNQKLWRGKYIFNVNF